MRSLESAYDGSYTALDIAEASALRAPDGPVPVGTAAPVGTTARQQTAEATPTPAPAVETVEREASAEQTATEPTPVFAPAETPDLAAERMPDPVAPMPATPLSVEAPAVRRRVDAAPHTPVGDAFTSAAYDNRFERRVPSWVPVLAGVVALLVVIGGIVWWLGRTPDAATPPEAAPSATAVPADTTTRPEVAAPAPASRVALRDTNTLVLRATAGRLSGIRLRVDDDVRRPYWLEQGTERSFGFRDSAFVYAPLGGVTLLVNGTPIDTAALKAGDGTVRITR